MPRRINHHSRPSGAFCGRSGTEVSDTYPEAGCIGPSMAKHDPCPDSRVLCPAGEVKLGDCIDVTALPIELGETTRMAGEGEYALIVEDSTWDASDLVVIHTEFASFAVSPDLDLVLGPHQPDMAHTDS